MRLVAGFRNHLNATGRSGSGAGRADAAIDMIWYPSSLAEGADGGWLDRRRDDVNVADYFAMLVEDVAHASARDRSATRIDRNNRERV
jgi:hypothetical protein